MYIYMKYLSVYEIVKRNPEIVILRRNTFLLGVEIFFKIFLYRFPAPFIVGIKNLRVLFVRATPVLCSRSPSTFLLRFSSIYIFVTSLDTFSLPSFPPLLSSTPPTDT